MRLLTIVLSLLGCGCITIKDIPPSFDKPYKVNETNYMKTPCILDGSIVKKKPKVNNI